MTSQIYFVVITVGVFYGQLILSSCILSK